MFNFFSKEKASFLQQHFKKTTVSHLYHQEQPDFLPWVFFFFSGAIQYDLNKYMMAKKTEELQDFDPSSITRQTLFLFFEIQTKC